MTVTSETHEWVWADGYDKAYRQTDDPRVLEMIVRDNDYEAPYGDALCPAYYVEYRGGDYRADRAGTVYHDDESDTLAATLLDARDRFRYAAGYRRNGLSLGMSMKSDALLERYMRVMHATTFKFIDFPDGTVVLLLDTPGYRAYVGNEDPTTDITGEAAEWRAYVTGDVWAIGHAINEARVLPDADIDLADFRWEYECGNVFDEASAKGMLQDFDMPDLPTMLELA